MEKINDIVKGLCEDVEMLLKHCKQKDADLALLADENRELKIIVEQYKNQIEDLKEKNKLIKIARSIEGESVDGKTELKYKINEILREVDRCLGLLNK